jgi:hypothetical protein
MRGFHYYFARQPLTKHAKVTVTGNPGDGIHSVLPWIKYTTCEAVRFGSIGTGFEYLVGVARTSVVWSFLLYGYFSYVVVVSLESIQPDDDFRAGLFTLTTASETHQQPQA